MDIILYTKDSCPACVQAKTYMKENNIEFHEYKIGVDVSRDSVISLFPAAKTVPIAVVDGVWIGGKTELLERLKND